MDHRLATIALALLLLPAATARAFVLVAVPNGAEELAQELELELGPDSRVVCDDSEQEQPIDARVALVREAGRTEVRVTHRALPAPLRSATAADADPRTLAIVAAELIAEADERFLDALPRLEARPRHTDRRPRSAATAERPPSFQATRLAMFRRHRRGGGGFTAAVGFGGFAAIQSSHRREGGQARLLVGHRFDERFRLGALLEGGVLSEPRSADLQLEPWGRGCVEGAIGVPARPLAVYVAAHPCLVLARYRGQPGPTSDPDGYDRDHGWFTEQLTISASVGGAIAFGLEVDGVHVWLRVDLDATFIGTEAYVMPVVSALLGSA